MSRRCRDVVVVVVVEVVVVVVVMDLDGSTNESR